MQKKTGKKGKTLIIVGKMILLEFILRRQTTPFSHHGWWHGSRYIFSRYFIRDATYQLNPLICLLYILYMCFHVRRSSRKTRSFATICIQNFVHHRAISFGVFTNCEILLCLFWSYCVAIFNFLVVSNLYCENPYFSSHYLVKVFCYLDLWKKNWNYELLRFWKFFIDAAYLHGE